MIQVQTEVTGSIWHNPRTALPDPTSLFTIHIPNLPYSHVVALFRTSHLFLVRVSFLRTKVIPLYQNRKPACPDIKKMGLKKNTKNHNYPCQRHHMDH